MKSLDLNADLGEGCGDDEAMLDLVTSANVACGGHAGDEEMMSAACAAASARGVRIGAHVAYPDVANFGRVFIDMPASELRDTVRAQLRALAVQAEKHGSSVRYIKPHGALYHAVTKHPEQAQVLADLAAEHGVGMVGAPGSLVLQFTAQAGLDSIAEGFADRAYNADGSLVSRDQPGAVIHERDQVAARVRKLLESGVIASLDGTEVQIAIRTLCIHGDTPEAVQIARAVRAEFERAGIAPEPFA